MKIKYTLNSVCDKATYDVGVRLKHIVVRFRLKNGK